MSPIDTFSRSVPAITIVGTGLLGGSLGLGLRTAGYSGRIIGVGRRASTAAQAVARGCVDEGTTDLAAAVGRSRLVVLATPLGRFAGLLEQISALDHAQLVITDLGSTKAQVGQDARRLLPVPQRFVGSHPMAGSEQRGPAAARADLFGGKPCIITPETDTDPESLRTVEAMWKILGMRVLHMSARQHDRKTAVISHLPHAVAVLLIRVAGACGGLQIASTGFADTTRLASSNPTMRCDIMIANRDELLRALEVLQDHAEQLRTVLVDGDAAQLLALLEAAQQKRDDWLESR